MSEDLQQLYVKHKHFDVGELRIVRRLQNPNWLRLEYKADNNVIIIEDYHTIEELGFSKPSNYTQAMDNKFKFQPFQFVKHKFFPEIEKMLIVKINEQTGEYGIRYLANDRILVFNWYHENELEPWIEPSQHPIPNTSV